MHSVTLFLIDFVLLESKKRIGRDEISLGRRREIKLNRGIHSQRGVPSSPSKEVVFLKMLTQPEKITSGKKNERLIGIRAVSVSSIFFSLIEGDVLSVLCLQVKPVSMLDEIFKLKTVQYQSVLARDEQMCLLRLVQFSF